MTTSRSSYLKRAELCPAPAGKALFTLMDEKKTNLALSVDVRTVAELLTLADTLGPEICLLKTHIDTIDDFTPACLEQLKALAKKHKFMIFEDRKFADIGTTARAQYQGGIFKIASWSHLINAHGLPGAGMIEGLAEAGRPLQRGLILVAEMSSKGHLLTPAYRKSTLDMARNFPDFVVGFITQQAVCDSEPQWINLTPGINLSKGDGSLGQQYNTPETAMENGTDVIIVGQGIYKADKPLEVAREFRQRGWDAYQKRLTLATIPRPGEKTAN